MKVFWEETDINAGRRVWKDMECMICSQDGLSGFCAIVVVETGRIMHLGGRSSIADYLNAWEYRPVEER